MNYGKHVAIVTIVIELDDGNMYRKALYFMIGKNNGFL